MTGIIKAKIKNLSKTQWLAILGLVALFLALRWNNYAAPLGRDEGEYAYASQLLIQGIAPYQHAFIQKPPAVIYTYALSNLLFPHVYWSSRILAALFEALATVLLGLIAWLEFGEGFALPVMWLVTPMILLPNMELADANVEAFILLPLMATVATYCYSRQHGNKPMHWFAAGFFAATTLLYKYTALPILVFVFFAWLIDMWRNGSKPGSILLALGSALAGGILATALELAFFFAHDGAKSFWECTITFNRYYAGTDNFSLGFFWAKCRDFWDNWWILFIIPWAILLQPKPRLWFWLGIFISALLATSGSVYGHYYTVITPCWALLTVLGINNLAASISQRTKQPSPRLASFIAIVVVVLVILPDLPWMLRTSSQFVRDKTRGYPFIEAQLLAAQVSQLSSPDDFVYVAGSEPEILYYARRFSPTRFITTYPLMIPTPLAPGYQQEAIHDLQLRPPKLIVFAQTGSGWLRQAATPPEFQAFIGSFLKQNYTLMGAYVKTDAQTGFWSTNLNVAEFENSSLLLYERKSGS